MDAVAAPRVACPRSAGDERATRLNGWLLTDGRGRANAAALLTGLAERLIEAGVPLYRATLHLPQIHPQFAGYTAVWTAGQGIVRDRTVSRDDLASPMYLDSPMGLMHRTGQPVRRHLEGADAANDFPVYDELMAEGVTDYLLTPLDAGNRRRPGFSIATCRPGGFAQEDADLAAAIIPALGAVIDIMLQRWMTESLLDAYVGRQAARHILDGEVVAGGGRSIDAVVLFADLRGFTALSETLPRDRVLDLLNEFLASVIGPVHEHGGEILKFLGDGVLAVFPLAQAPEEDGVPADGEDEIVAHAIMAALEVQTAVAARNDERRDGGAAELRAGIALHVGSVLFGNIGTEERLDFTVIGPAVNLAARLERLAGEIDRPILVSERFAQRCPVQLSHEGRYRLRGLAEPQEVYAPVVLALA